MTPKELGQLFVDLVEIDGNGCSPQIYMKDLVEIEPEFRTTNGSQWSRANGWLGKQYLIQKTYKSGRVDSIQLVGKILQMRTILFLQKCMLTIKENLVFLQGQRTILKLTIKMLVIIIQNIQWQIFNLYAR